MMNKRYRIVGRTLMELTSDGRLRVLGEVLEVAQMWRGTIKIVWVGGFTLANVGNVRVA